MKRSHKKLQIVAIIMVMELLFSNLEGLSITGLSATTTVLTLSFHVSEEGGSGTLEKFLSTISIG
jgi:hypothetical protein